MAGPIGSTGSGDDRPSHPMAASIVLVVVVSLLIVALAVASSLP